MTTRTLILLNRSDWFRRSDIRKRTPTLMPIERPLMCRSRRTPTATGRRAGQCAWPGCVVIDVQPGPPARQLLSRH